jgi:hypothetical protein
MSAGAAVRRMVAAENTVKAVLAMGMA